jgi:mannonate dehydratase
MLGAPERDRDIERMCRSVEAAGKTGVPLLMWNFGRIENSTWLLRSPGVTRGASPLMYTRGVGRGGTMAPTYDYEDVQKDIQPRATVFDPEEGWERLAYVVEGVMPTADEYGVRMASHPNDIPIPQGTAYKGVTPLLSNVEGLKRFVNLYDSPLFGICFCQGCVAEFSTDLEQVYDAISYFGKRGKIFWIHFRNIRGKLGRFMEVYHDEGDLDMYRAMRLYKSLGVNAGIVPDHMPIAEDEPSEAGRSHAFALGYIRALIQVVNAEYKSSGEQ